MDYLLTLPMYGKEFDKRHFEADCHRVSGAGGAAYLLRGNKGEHQQEQGAQGVPVRMHMLALRVLRNNC